MDSSSSDNYDLIELYKHKDNNYVSKMYIKSALEIINDLQRLVMRSPNARVTDITFKKISTRLNLITKYKMKANEEINKGDFLRSERGQHEGDRLFQETSMKKFLIDLLY